jgi:hypothetical protein
MTLSTPSASQYEQLPRKYKITYKETQDPMFIFSESKEGRLK